MNNYENYTATELASDAEFIKWIKNPKEFPEVTDFWVNWLDAHPHKQEEVSEAKELMSLFQSNDVHEERRQPVWDRIEDSLDEIEEESKTVQVNSWWGSIKDTYKYAAAVVLMVLAAAYFYSLQDSSSIVSNGVVAESLLFQNVNEKPRTIMLSDGSSVVLYQNTSIQIASAYNEKERTVSIHGKAYFEIQRNEEKPFYVQADGVTTKVLGTSFLVTAYDQQDVTVVVNTGKVSVFKETENKELQTEITLIENESASFTRRTAELKRVNSTVENIEQALYRDDFEIKNKPLREVFDLLQTRYGVDIKFDDKKIAECYLNASLVGIPLEDKVRLICKGSNLSYRMLNDTIIIEGEGCTIQ